MNAQGEQVEHGCRQHRQRQHDGLQERLLSNSLRWFCRAPMAPTIPARSRPTCDTRFSEPGTARDFTTSSTDAGDRPATASSLVEDTNGVPMLTRAGSFVPDGDGKLVNAAGLPTLLGYDYESGVPAPVVNGFDGPGAGQHFIRGAWRQTRPPLVSFQPNLDAGEAIVAAADLPSNKLRDGGVQPQEFTGGI